MMLKFEGKHLWEKSVETRLWGLGRHWWTKHVTQVYDFKRFISDNAVMEVFILRGQLATLS